MAERKVGPRETCPACQSTNVTSPVYCSSLSRVWVGFLKWCEKEGSHLHQKCSVCKFKWTCTPVSITEKKA